MRETVARYRWVILGLAMITQFGVALVGQVLAPLAPLFQPELGLTKTEVGLFASATFAGVWTVSLVAGSLTDRFGIRKLMSIGQIVGGALILSMSVVGSVVEAATVMFAAGLARGMSLPGSTKSIMDWFPPAGRATAMGLKQAGMPIAGIAAASLLPILGLMLGWRSAIAIAGLFVIACGVAVAVLYRDPGQSGKVSGQRANMRAGLGDVIRNRRLWALAFMAVLLVASQMALIAYLPLYMKEVVLVAAIPDERTRIVAAGGFLALCQVGGVLGRVFWGVVSDRIFHGRRVVVLSIVGFLSAVMSLVVGRLTPDFPLWLITAVLFVYGISGIGWNGVYHAAVPETAGRKYAGTGLGLTMTVTQMGNVGGPPLFGFVVDLSGSYQPAWVLLSGLCACSVVAGILLGRGEKGAS